MSQSQSQQQQQSSSSQTSTVHPQFRIYMPLDWTQQILVNQLTCVRKPPTKQAVVALAAACEAIQTFLIQSAIESQIRAIQTRMEQRKSLQDLSLHISPRDLKVSMFTDSNMNPFFEKQQVIVSSSGAIGGIQKCLIPRRKH